MISGNKFNLKRFFFYIHKYICIAHSTISKDQTYTHLIRVLGSIHQGKVYTNTMVSLLTRLKLHKHKGDLPEAIRSNVVQREISLDN